MRNLVASRVPLGDLWFLVALAQGVEYLLRPHGSTLVLNAVESALPLWAWGGLLTLPGLTGLAANRLKRWVLSVFCHISCAAVYAGLCYGIIAGVIEAQQRWGWQLAVGYACFVTLHGLWAVIDRIRDRANHLAAQGDL